MLKDNESASLIVSFHRDDDETTIGDPTGWNATWLYLFPPNFDSVLWAEDPSARYTAHILDSTKDLKGRATPGIRYHFVKEGRHKKKQSAEFVDGEVVPPQVVEEYCRLFRDGLRRSLRVKVAVSEGNSSEDDDKDNDADKGWSTTFRDGAPAELIPIDDSAPQEGGESRTEPPLVLRMEFLRQKFQAPSAPRTVSVRGPSTWPGKFYVPSGSVAPPEGRQESECVFHDRHLASLMDCRVFRAPQDPETASEVSARMEKPWRTNVFVGEDQVVLNVCTG